MTRIQAGGYNGILFLGCFSLYGLPRPVDLGEGLAGFMFLLVLMVGALTLLRASGAEEELEEGPAMETGQATGEDPAREEGGSGEEGFGEAEGQDGISWDLILIGLGGVVLSAFYWWRASMATGTIESHLSFVIGRAFFFWVPSVAPAILYRAPGEGWLPVGRGRYALRLAMGVVAGGVGAVIQFLITT